MNQIDKNDIVDSQFAKLKVKEYSHSKNGSHFYLCECECGGTKIVNRSSLIKGGTKSCGCMRSENSKKLKGKRFLGKLKSKIPNELFDFKLWDKCKATLNGMYSRCYREYSHGYKNYGARGIKICDDWLDYKGDGLVNFYLWSIDSGISEKLSIDRIDVNGNYEPSNCRWTTVERQNDNKGNTIYIEYNGEIKLVKEWAKITGVPYSTILARYKNGIIGDELFTLPTSQFKKLNYTHNGVTKTFNEWASEYKIPISKLKKSYKLGSVSELLNKKQINKPSTTNKKEIDKNEYLRIIDKKLDKILKALGIE